MQISIGRLLTSLRWPLAVVLLFLQAAAIGDAPAPASAKADPGFEWSIEEGTQFNFDKLSVGLGYVGGGAYLDMVGARKDGLHASIDISIEGDPSQFRQPDVHEGQILLAGGYRILIEKIIPGQKGILVLRVWGPPKSADK
jgi:hypothetical protein